MLKKYLYSGLLLLTITTCVDAVVIAEETGIDTVTQEQLTDVSFRVESSSLYY